MTAAKVRLFLALELPDDARAQVAGWRSRLFGDRPELRPVAPESLHVTLVFLGWQAERDVARINELASRASAAGRVASLEPTRLRPLPPRRPRLFALELADPDGRCVALQAALVKALAAAELHRPERRPFWPHITLARVRRGQRAPRLASPPPPPARFVADKLVLYRSTLRPQGALYEPLTVVTLDP